MAVGYDVLVSPSQFEWPHRHINSVRPAVPSQCALQYFEPLGAMQLQLGFAHFLLGFAIAFLLVDGLSLRGHGAGKCDFGFTDANPRYFRGRVS